MSTSPLSEQTAGDASTDMSDEAAQEQAESRAALDIQLKSILADVLGLDADDASALDKDSGLFGHLPELDSMAVAGLLTEMEDRLDIMIEDDDVDGEMLETYGGLLDFAERKLSES